MRNNSPERSYQQIRFFRFIAFLLLFFILGSIFFAFIAQSRWDGKRRFTLVVQNFENPKEAQENAKLLIFSIEPRQSRAAYIFLPPAVILDVPYGYKSYRASSVYTLGELDKARGGGKLLAKAIENTFGVIVDGYLVGQKNILPFLTGKREEMREIKRIYFSISGIGFFISSLFSPSYMKTNLSVVDRFRIWNTMRQLREDQISFLNLGDGNVLSDDILPDKTPVLEVNKDIFDAIIKDMWEDAQVRAERISLRIVNATNEEGLAARFSRILEHLGVNVVEMTTAKKQEKEGCTLFITQKSLASSAIIDKLKDSYHCQLREENNPAETADVTLVLGENFLQ